MRDVSLEEQELRKSKRAQKMMKDYLHTAGLPLISSSCPISAAFGCCSLLYVSEKCTEVLHLLSSEHPADSSVDTD